MTKLRYRESALELLEALSILDHRLGPVELICGWFDDFYFPDLNDWRQCFQDHELQTLAAFHTQLEGLLTDLSRDWATYQTDSGWQQVAVAATQALIQLQRLAPPATQGHHCGNKCP